jgi:hypothetical protein
MEEPRIAFIVETPESPAIQIRVNFGVFAGRPATAAEIDKLAMWLLDEVDGVTIVAEERHEIDDTVEASVHQVRVELAADRAPEDRTERRSLAERLVERADYWARMCIAERHTDASDL